MLNSPIPVFIKFRQLKQKIVLVVCTSSLKLNSINNNIDLVVWIDFIIAVTKLLNYS